MSYFSRYDENLALLATTITVSDPVDGYPASNGLDPFMVKPIKIGAPTGWVLYEYDDPVLPVAVALIYQYLDAGLSVRIQGNSSSDFSSPAFDQAITIPPKRKDGPSYQPWTFSPWVLLVEPSAYAFWRVKIVGTNSQDVHIGHVFLASALHHVELFHADGDITHGERPPDDPSQIVHKTQVGVERVVTIAGPRRELAFVMIGSDYGAGTQPVQDAQVFRDLCEATDGVERPFLFIPFEDNDAWLVRPTTPQWARGDRQGGAQVWAMSVRELARPLPWP